MQDKGLSQEEECFLRNCFEGDAKAVAVYLRNYKGDTIHYNALTNACGQGHEDVVELLLNDPRVAPGAEKNDAFAAAVIHEHPALMRRLYSLITLDEKHAYNFAYKCQLHHLFAFLVERSKTAPIDAFYMVPDTRILCMLLDKPHVALSVRVICTYIFNKRVDFLRVLADTPWLGFSRRTLLHLQLYAEKHDVPHVFPALETASNWETEEAVSVCHDIHAKSLRYYEKANPTVLAVVWCTHQIVGWSDMAEPLIDRLPPVVTLKLDTEGPVLGIPGAPIAPPGLFYRAWLIFIGIVGLWFVFGSSFYLTKKYSENHIGWDILILVGGIACLLTAKFGPSFSKI